MEQFNFIYLLVAGLTSLFYGVFAVKKFWGETRYKELKENKKIELVWQLIFNFLGAAVGFLVLYFLIRKAMFCISTGEYDYESIIDVLLLIIALLGISACLPAVTYKLTEGIGQIIDKIIELIAKIMAPAPK